MKRTFFLFAMVLFLSCDKNDPISVEDDKMSSEVDLLNNRMIFESKGELQNFLNNHKDTDLDKQVGKLYTKGFKPLTPYGMEKGTKQYTDFIERKKSRIAKNATYGLKGYKTSEDFDTDDELIADPDFAAILDENRSIYVGDELYVYTEDGAYFCKIENEQKLWDYLEQRQEAIKGQSVNKYIEPITDPCEDELRMVEGEEGLTLEPPTGEVYSVTEDISLYTVCGGGGGGGGSYPDPDPIPAKIPLAEKANFKFCAIYKKSLWQQAFGAVEECNTYFDDDHRVKGRFWNVNYHLWASTGVLVKHQSRALIGWTRSDGVDYTELGVNALVYNIKSSMAKYFKQAFIGNYLTYQGQNYLIRGNTLVPTTDFPALPNWAYNSRDPYNYDVELFLFTKEVKDLEGDDLKDYVIELINSFQSAGPVKSSLISDNASVKALVPPVNDNYFRTVVYNRNQQTTEGKIKTDLVFTAFQFKELSYSSEDVQDLIDSGVFTANEGADASGTGSSEKTFIDALKQLSEELPSIEIRTTEEHILKSVDIYGACRKGGDTYRGIQFGLRDDY